jgi:hypothetical protein
VGTVSRCSTAEQAAREPSFRADTAGSRGRADGVIWHDFRCRRHANLMREPSARRAMADVAAAPDCRSAETLPGMLIVAAKRVNAEADS